MADIYPSYLNAKAAPGVLDFYTRTDATRPAPATAAQPQPQPFNLQLQPPPPVPALPPLNINTAATQSARQGAPRVAAPSQPLAPPSEFTNPKGIPANAIPVIRGFGAEGLNLSYDIPGTFQRLYPTLEGKASEFTPEQRFELSRYTEPAKINAAAGVQEAGIHAGATLGAANIAQKGETARQNTLIQTLPRQTGQSTITDQFGGIKTAADFGLPEFVNGQPTGNFRTIGPGAQRAVNTTQEGATGVDRATGTKVVYKNGKWVAAGQ